MSAGGRYGIAPQRAGGRLMDGARVMSREVISWIAAVAVAALFVAIVLWLRTFALAPG
jgi:hypothetical protein